ncbi:MAG TPA: hypothetical protein VKB07_09835 [Gaiellaceae bacterium]|nr:hypothetical protein [Gaiellaceae bacterium]
MSEHEPSEAELEEARAKQRLRDAEVEADETLERAEELSEEVPKPPPPPD